MLAKLKLYGLVILSGALAVLYALFKSSEAKRYKDKVKVAQGSVRTLTQANKARVEAEKRGRERLRAKTSSRNRFD